MSLRFAWRLFLCEAVVSLLFAQKPAVDQNGIRNAASLLPAASVAPQMIVAILGTNLAASTDSASFSPLPASLGGATVTFNGTPAPLLFVSPEQINAQVPSDLRGSRSAEIVVTTAAGSSEPVRLGLAARALGILTQDSSGCGAGVVFNVHADETLSLNTPENSFDPTHDLGLRVLFTGLGFFSDRQDGVEWVFNSFDNQIPGNRVDAWFGVPDFQESDVTNTRYAGPATGKIGIDQVDTQAFAAAEIYEGCHVPLYLTDYVHSASQLVNVSIRRGGGACIDPPPDRLAVITWRRNATFDATSTVLSEGVDAQFRQGSRLVFPAAPSAYCCQAAPPPTASCRASLPATIGAGTITIAGVTGSPIIVQPQGDEGDVKYEASLPIGSLLGGTYQITATGGPVIGAFDAAAGIPGPITLTALPKPGDTVVLPYRIAWTGGDDRSVVAVQFRIYSSAYSPYFEFNLTASAAAGVLELPFSYFQGPFGPPGTFPQGDTEIIVTQRPGILSASSETFSAPGLTKGGEQTWTYVWDVRDLKH